MIDYLIASNIRNIKYIFFNRRPEAGKSLNNRDFPASSLLPGPPFS